MGRFSADRPGVGDDQFCHNAIKRSGEILEQAAGSDEGPLPFPTLSRLAALARGDACFAPIERASRMIDLGGRGISLEQAGPRAPLWALDLALGELFTRVGVWHLGLPCPGAMTPHLLAPELWPGERRLAIAEAVEAGTARLVALTAIARSRARTMGAVLAHLRSSARAPQVWMTATAFAPLGLGQIAEAFGVSRRGTYTIAETLEVAGCAERAKRNGMVILSGREPHQREAGAGFVRSGALPSPALEEFDAALADIDRLLGQRRDNTG